MPQEIEYEFGKTAVQSGQLTQDQLEECIEVLVALERVGTRQRLWDIARRKGYIAPAAVDDILRQVGASPTPAPPSTPPPTAGLPPPPRPPKKRPIGEMSWQMPAAIEVASVTDPMMRAGLKPLRGDPVGRTPKAHKPGQLVLTCVEGPLEGKKFPLSKRVTVIGREPPADIVADDLSVSRRHAELVLTEKQTEVRDPGSRNGVFVNGKRITPAAVVQPGDTIRVGRCLMVIEEVSPSPPAQ